MNEHGITNRDEAALRLVESSRLWRGVASCLIPLSTAATASYVVGKAGLALGHWRALNWCVRRRAVAIMLMVAGVTHMVVNAGLGTPVGSMWLATPVTAIVLGGVLYLFSMPPQLSKGAN